MYQAAVSNQDTADFSSRVLEEAEPCSMPGGLASIRRQFENEQISSAHTFTQSHYKQRSRQEVQSSSELSVRSGMRGRETQQDERVLHEESVSWGAASAAENHQVTEEEVYYPKLSTKELAKHFEKTIEEAAPNKKIKIEHDANRSKWASGVNVHYHKGEIFDTSNDTVGATGAEAEIPGTVCATVDDDSDYLPPPPPDLLEDLPEDPGFKEPPEPSCATKHTMSKDQYFKQRELLELKRLCKHIHPDVRKDLERDFYNEVNDMDEDENIIVGDVQETTYHFEQSGSSPNQSPEREYLEWDEILRGEVQSMRWMFENRPLDCIKDSSDDEEESRKIDQQEIIAGGDVRNTALMFETQPMDVLGADTSYSGKKLSYNKIGKKDVRAAAWLFETKPMDSLNKMHGDDEQTKEVVFTQEIARGNVKSMRYMFENPEMDSLGDTETMDEKHLLNLKSVMEEIKDDMKKTIWLFGTQCKCVLREHSGELVEITSVRREETEKGDVKTSRWLFETQPLDKINRDLSQFRLISSISMEDNIQGDVKRGRWLFETKRLDSITEEWESIHGQQREEILGADVRRHCMVFETQPMDTLKDDSNSRPVATEEIIGGDVQSVRHLFETAPLNELKELPEVGKLKKRVETEEEGGGLRHQKWVFEKQPLEIIQNADDGPGRLKETVASEGVKGDVKHQKWLFENQKLEDIREEKKEVIKMVNIEQDDEESYKGDVRRNCWVFETQSMDTLKDDSNAKPVSTEEIIGGDVQSARHFFETAPKDELKELAEVGKLKKKVTSEEEKGDVRHQKWVFESQPLEQIREEKKEVSRTVNVENTEKVDITNYKQIFETYDLNRYDESQKIKVEGVTKGSVKSNKDLFESTPLYTMQDSSGHYHEVKSVRHEEIVKGDVKSYKWMFETCPIDQFDESITKFQVIKGITQQEVEAGDVKTAKWLFETQPLDAIKYFSNIEDEACIAKETTEIVKGDVKTCKWLFETKPMDVLYEKAEIKNENDTNEVHKGDVKTCTWLFETQALDTIRDDSEAVLNACTIQQEDIQGKDVRMARVLFETENLENITGEEGRGFKRVTEIDIQSGDVSRMKYIFETQASDAMTSTSEEFMRQLKTAQAEDIQKGNVGNCKWLFENQPIDVICQNPEELKVERTVTDVQGGNVDKGRFIFETCSLDKIQEVSAVSERQKIIREEEEKGDVKNYAMMFETLPLYAIQDKDGHYHEVTTLTKEELLKGDVVGARWLFETKPLDSIRDTDEVYIIKAVTEEDIQKGDVTSARWRFETQPLDEIVDDSKLSVRTVQDVKGGDVKANKQHFESDLMSQKLIRTVSMSEIHKGDVKAAKWMFETHTIDQIHGDNSEDEMETVVMQEQVKGDVKQSVWLFEKNPLDHIKENEENKECVREEIPKADVKTTTWLFETTPISEFNENNVEKTEIIGKNIKETLDELYSQRMVDSKGIIIETDEIGDVRMAKYNLMNKEVPKIQKEEIIKGDLQNIMMNLLNSRDAKEKGIIIDAEERGNISNTVQQLFNQQTATNVEKEEIIRGDIQEAINNLLKEESMGKHGILIQEDEKGDVRMTIYSLFNKKEDVTAEKEDVISGNVKSCVQKLYNPDNPDIVKIKVDDTEKGRVSFFSTCIESGALDYLKQIQVEQSEDESGKLEKEEIVGGDIKGTKLSLTSNQAQICRLVDKEDIVPGDVHNTVKVFMTEPPVSFEQLHKEEIVGGDLRATLDSLTQSINQSVILEKEEVVKGDIPTVLKSLEEAQKQPKEVEKPEIIPGDIKGALKSLKDVATTKVEIVIEDLVSGNIKGTLKSLEEAKQAVKQVEKEEIVRGDIHTALQNLQEASNERKAYQQEVALQGDVKGTIQLLLEPPSSPRMQRRASTEGDVQLSIKSLYETQEQLQSEKEDVIKGDVKGTIKCLLETAQKASPKIPRREPIRKVKVPKVKTPSSSQKEIQAQRPAAVKNLTKSNESQRHVQKLVNNKSMQSGSTSLKKNTLMDQTTTNMQTSETTMLEHKTIVQTHGVKTLKTEFCNLHTDHKGISRLDKTTDIQQEVQAPSSPKPSHLPEPDFPLPPSPPPDYDSLFFPTPPSLPRGDNDLPPPPTPPPPLSDTLKSDLDQLPPPPTPPPPPLAPVPASEQEVLPPPPSQQELDLIPNTVPGKPTKLTVRPVKAPALCKVPKLEPAMQLNKIDMQAQATMQVTSSHKTVEKIGKEKTQSIISSVSPTPSSSEIKPAIAKLPPESPRPPKKVFAPMSFTPPASPPPSKSPLSKFKTPLIKAEQKYRQQQEESYTPPSSPAFEIHMHESVRSALEMISSDVKNTTRSEQGISLDITQKKAEKTVTQVKSDTESYELSKRVILSDVTASKPLIFPTNEKSPSEFAIISSVKDNISNQPSQPISCQQQTTSTTSKKKKKYRTITTNIHQVKSTSVIQSQVVINNSANILSLSDGKGNQTISENISLTSDANKKDITQVAEKDKFEEIKKTDISKNKAQEKKSPDRAKVNAGSKIKEAEQKPQKAESQKTKKGNKNNKDEVTEKKPTDPVQSVKVAHEIVQVKQSREQKLTETETKVEKQAKQKQVEETPATPKKKRRAKPKRDKEVAEHAQGQVQNNITAVEPAPSSEAKHPALTSSQTHEETAVVQTQRTIQEEHTEVNSTKGKVQQSLQPQDATAKAQRQATASPKNKGETDIQTIPDVSKDESRNVPLQQTGKPAQKDGDVTTPESRETTQPCAEGDIQMLLAHIMELQVDEGILDHKSLKTLLSKAPEWIFGPEGRHDLEEALEGANILKLKEIIAQVQGLVQEKLMHFEGDAETLEKHECEATSEKMILGTAPQRISKITIGSTKVEVQKKVVEEKKATHKSRKHQEKSVKPSDPRAPSPSLRMRSPSPTFITIESIRRTGSPQRVVPSPPPLPPTPPPRRSETPTSRLSRASPSPTLGRADSLTRLREATAKLSRGPSPDPVPRPMPLTGKKSEIVETPATFHRQIKIDARSAEDVKFLEEKEDIESSGVAVTESAGTSVQEMHEFFKGAPNAEENKTLVQKDLSEHTGLHTDQANSHLSEKEKEPLTKVYLSGLVNTFETLEEKVYTTKKPVGITEMFEDPEPNTKKKANQQEDTAAYDMKVIKNVFEMGEQSSSIKEQQNKQEGQVSRANEIAFEGSKHEPQQSTQQPSQQATAPPLYKEVTLEKSVDPVGFSGTQAITEHYHTVDEFGMKMSGTRSTTTVSKHSESVFSQCAPFSYADAVKKKAPEAKTSPEACAEELLQNFHKTWAESESVFKSLGYSVSVPKSEMCTVCRTRVYPMEGLIADKKKFHKSCFTCEYCKNKLNLGNYVSLHGHLYCPPHYKQLFKSKGYFDEVFGQGSQKELLSTTHLKNTSTEGLNWRHSLSQSSVSSISDMFEKEASKLYEKDDQTSQKRNKISVVWPPQTDSPKKPFTTDQDVQFGKPVWPPKSESSKSPKYK